MQGKKWSWRRERPHISDRNGKRTELVVQDNGYWLTAKILNGGVDSGLLCAIGDVQMRAVEDRAERLCP